MTITEAIGIGIGCVPLLVGAFSAYSRVLSKLALIEAKFDKILLQMKGEFSTHVRECEYERKSNLERYTICQADIRELSRRLDNGKL